MTHLPFDKHAVTGTWLLIWMGTRVSIFHLHQGIYDFLFSVDLLTYRAYNPRLFRLQNRLGIEEPEENQFTEEKKKSPKTRESLEEKQKRAAANRDKVKEFQKVGSPIVHDSKSSVNL